MASPPIPPSRTPTPGPAPLRLTRPAPDTVVIHMENEFVETLPPHQQQCSDRSWCPEDTPGWDPITRLPWRLLSQLFYMVLPPSATCDPQAWHLELWETLVNAPQEAAFFTLLQGLHTDTTSQQPDTTHHHPDTTPQHPDTMSHHPDNTSQHLDTTPQYLDTTPHHLDTTTHHRDTTHHHPDTTRHNPDTMSHHPDTTPHHPDNTSQHLDTMPQHPDNTSHHPDTRTNHPDNTPHHPDNTSQHPDTKRHHPDTTPHHPDTTRHHPDTTRHHPDTPTHHPDTTRHHPDTPTHHPDTTRHHPDTPTHHPDTIPHHPATTRHHPDTTRHHPDTPTHHPDTIPHHPATTPHNPDNTSQHLDTTPHHPYTKPQHPDTKSHYQDTTPHHQDTMPQHPDTTPHHPDTMPHHPDTVSHHPDTVSHHPGTTTHHPETTPHHPDTTSQQPDTTPQHPDTTHHHPDTTSQQPDTTPQHPDTTPQLPDTTTHHLDTSTLDHYTHHPDTATLHSDTTTNHQDIGSDRMQHIVTGSRAERLNMPGLVSLGTGGEVTEVHHSDLDILFSVGTANPQCLHLVGAGDTNLPGYVRYSGPEVRVMAALHDYLAQKQLFLTAMHGPALMGDRPLAVWDFVVCLHHPTWPAAGWAARPRPAGWPPAKLVREVVSGGCHILQKVPPQRAGSRDDRYTGTWHRYSFSVAERKLALSLTEGHRHSYLLLRVLLFQCLKDTDVLNSYHLKNVFFWACEQVPSGRWTKEYLAENTLYLLDRLVHCMAKGSLPHYFIPQNNLLRNVHRDALRRVATKLVAIRRHPLACLETFFSQYHFITGPFSLSVGRVVRETADRVMACPRQARDAALDACCLDLAAAHIADCPHTECLAADLLLGRPLAGGQRALAVTGYTRRTLRPLLAAADLLAARGGPGDATFMRLWDLYWDAHDQQPHGKLTARSGTGHRAEEVGHSSHHYAPDNPIPDGPDTETDHTHNELSESPGLVHDLQTSKDAQLRALAALVPPLLPPVDALIQDLDRLVLLGREQAVTSGQLVLGMLFSYHLVVAHHPSALEAACHLHYLQEVAEYLGRGAFPDRYAHCARTLLTHALLRQGLLHDITSFLTERWDQGRAGGTEAMGREQSATRDGQALFQEKGGPQADGQALFQGAEGFQALPQGAEGPQSDTPVLPHGRLYGLQKHDLVDNSVSEVIRNLEFVRALPKDNLVKGYLQHALEDRLRGSGPTYRLAHAIHLFLAGHYDQTATVTEALLRGPAPDELHTTRRYNQMAAITQDLLRGPPQDELPTTPGPPHVFYLSVPLALSLLGPPLVVGLRRTFRLKVPVHGTILAGYLRVAAVIRLRAMEDGRVRGYVRDLRQCCEDLLQEALRQASGNWYSLSNNLTLTARALWTCGRPVEAVYTLSQAAAVHSLWGRRSLSWGVGAGPRLTDSLSEALELSLSTHWSAVPLLDALPCLATHLYPGRPPPDALGLLLDLLLPHPRDPAIVTRFLRRVEPWGRTEDGQGGKGAKLPSRGPEGDQFDLWADLSHDGDEVDQQADLSHDRAQVDLRALLSYMTTWQCALRVAYPRLGPEHRVRAYLRARYPQVCERHALLQVQQMTCPHVALRPWLVAFLLALAGEFPHYNTVLGPYVRTFYPDLPPEAATRHLLGLLYPGLPPSAVLCRLFEEYAFPGADWETAVLPLHPDPLRAVVLAMQTPGT